MNKLSSADLIVKKYTIASMGTGLIPIPFVDQIALMGVQNKMLSELTQIYKLPFSKDIGQSILKVLLTTLLSTNSLKVVLSHFLKFVPVIGTTIGGLSISMFNGASTYAIGQVFIQHFESGGTLLSFEPKKMQKDLKVKFKEGKQKTKEFEGEQLK